MAVAAAVLVLKLLAWGLTGSVALLADALESVVNVAAALAALAAVRYAAMPPDANHPYGHTKAEYFSAVLEGALIVLAAVLILHEAWRAGRCRTRRNSRCSASRFRPWPPPPTPPGRSC